MPRVRIADKADANQKAIKKALEDAGCTVEIISRPVDLLVGRAGRNYLLEVKGKRGRLTEKQRAFMECWRGQVKVVQTVEDALRAVGLLE